MECFMKANKVSNYNMRMLRENIRIPFILMIVVLYVMESLSAVLTFSRSVHIDITPFAFIFLVNNYEMQFVIAASAVILFCNAPFEDESYQYMISRAGKLSWGLGQILYILKMSILYIACLAAAAIIPFMGHIAWSNEWGKIWGTLGKTNAGAEFGVKLSVSQNIMRQYEPVDALMISVLLEFFCILCIGLLIYFGNKMTGKSVGTFMGAWIAVLDICVSNDWMDWAYGFSPVSLAQLDLFYGFAPKWGINLAYAVRFFLIAIIILSSLCVAANYKEKVINSK
ncbi:MAG: hypothetical protein HFI21_04815 [Lachnospiraceae bacterium]|jgi:hypothetical protein|nr:hypothetical protein [Lachnospiraceae bacterium]MCI9478308.1 hypothetical protein [Lachnospiraceae bacterium]